MGWTVKLPEPILLKDGRALANLAHARDFILGMPERHQAKDHWQQASELLMKVASGRLVQANMTGVANTLAVALKADGLI
jgi:hypothetical protein